MCGVCPTPRGQHDARGIAGQIEFGVGKVTEAVIARALAAGSHSGAFTGCTPLAADNPREKRVLVGIFRMPTVRSKPEL
jgi:hypothetical protein